MSLPQFTYLAPRTLKEASALLAEYGDKARLMAGGTDLLIRMSHRAAKPDFVIGLRRIPDLNQVRFDPVKGLTIGALARLSDVAEHPEVNKFFPALAKAAQQTATVQIRNMGTVVGNICNAAPSADNATPLLAHGARVLIVHPGGERTLPLDEFFRGPGLTALEPGELVKEIRADDPGPRSSSNYQKVSTRSKVDIAGIGVSALVRLDENGALERIRIALGAVAPIPMRALGAEKMLAGQVPSEDLIVQAAAKASEEARPITDVRASAAYRRKMVEVLTARAVQKAWELAQQRLAGCEL